MERVYVLDGLRSFIGTKNGVYRHVPAEKLGAAVLRSLLNRNSLREEEIDVIVGGNCVGGGGNITRFMALEAGIPDSVPAVTVDVQCGSSLEGIGIAAAKIESGLADLVVVGGFESSSTQPWRSYHENHPDYKDGERFATAQFIPGVHGENVMLEGAERAIAEAGVTKEEMDEWVLLSHHRAAGARASGALLDVIAPVYGAARDEGIRPGMSQKLLGRLPCVLPEGHFLNAGNACGMNDGAAFLILCSGKFLRIHGKSADFAIRDLCLAGGDPMKSPCTAILAVDRLLEKNGMAMAQIDCVEINEAFAVINVLFERAYPGTRDSYNIFGGALAYGHPYGASGAIIFLHLMKALEKKRGVNGICAVAAAGGIGTALLIERLNDLDGGW